MSSRLSEALGVDPAVNLPGALQPGQVTDDDLARLQAFAAAGQQPAQAPGGLFPGERAALAAIPAPQTPFSLMGMAKGAGTGMLDLMELGQTATRPEDIPPSAALAVPLVGGAVGAALAPRGALASGAARMVRPSAKSFKDEFSIDAFHGTAVPEDFRAFNLARGGEKFGLQELEGGSAFFSKDPNVANQFTFRETGSAAQAPGSARGRVLPVKIKPGKTAEFDLPRLIGNRDPEFMRLMDEAGKEFGAPTSQIIEMLEQGIVRSKQVRQGARNRGVSELNLPDLSVPFNPLLTAVIGKLAKQRGLDTATIKGMGEGGVTADTVMVFNPANVRGRFAKFDPAQAASADLLAANPAPAALPGILGSGGPARIPTTQDRAAILRGDLL